MRDSVRKEEREKRMGRTKRLFRAESDRTEKTATRHTAGPPMRCGPHRASPQRRTIDYGLPPPHENFSLGKKRPFWLVPREIALGLPFDTTSPRSYPPRVVAPTLYKPDNL